MSLITRTYSFTDGTTAYGSQVDSEIQNIVTVINGLDAGTSTWDIVKVVNGSSTPLIADNSTGSNSILDCRVNGTTKFLVDSAGGLQATKGCTAALPMNSNKITGLANGSAATDGAAFGQIPVFTAWTSWTPTFGGLGTVANVNFYYRRVGENMEIQGIATTGTVAGSTVSMTLPNSLVTSATVVRALNAGSDFSIVGQWGCAQNSNEVGTILADASDNLLFFGIATSSTKATSGTTGTSAMASSITFTVHASVPITGWNVYS